MTVYRSGSEWFARTFKPVKVSCTHPAERLVFTTRYGERQTVCLKCGKVTARQRIP